MLIYKLYPVNLSGQLYFCLDFLQQNSRDNPFAGFRGLSIIYWQKQKTPVIPFAEPSALENGRKKRTERSQALSLRLRQEPALIMLENVRQDVQTQSYRIHFTCN